MSYITADTIRTLREKKRCTQRELAAQIGVTDKAISKWETGRGLPDIALVEPLATALGVSVAELFSGEQIVNVNRAANMLHTHFYVCPLCGNVIHAIGEGSFSCCGIQLAPLEVESEESTDRESGNIREDRGLDERDTKSVFQDSDAHPATAHTIQVEQADGDYFVTLAHPMTKQHYISFIAYITTDHVHLRKLYPEQIAEARFPIMGNGVIYAYCNQHGLFSLAAPTPPRKPITLLV